MNKKLCWSKAMTILCKKLTVVAFKDFFRGLKTWDTMYIEDSFAWSLIRGGFKATLMRTLRAENRSEGSVEKRRDCRHRQTLCRVEKVWLAYRQNTVVLIRAFFSALPTKLLLFSLYRTAWKPQDLRVVRRLN